MTGPRVIERHGFVPPMNFYPGLTQASNDQMWSERIFCARTGCGLTYEAPVHWILAEDVTPFEEPSKQGEPLAPIGQ